MSLKDFDVHDLSPTQRQSLALTAVMAISKGEDEAFKASVETFLSTVKQITTNPDVEGCYDARVGQILDLAAELARDVRNIPNKDKSVMLAQWSAAAAGLLDAAGRLDSLFDPRTATA